MHLCVVHTGHSMHGEVGGELGASSPIHHSTGDEIQVARLE